MQRIAIIVISLFLTCSLSAQYIAEPEMISDDVALDSLLKLHKTYNKEFKNISGYRIQIFKGSGNSSLENARTLE